MLRRLPGPRRTALAVATAALAVVAALSAASCTSSAVSPAPSGSGNSTASTWPAPTPAMLALRSRYPAPGRLVALPDGRRLHIRVRGAGGPTVVMEAGSGDWGLTWDLVAPKVVAGSAVASGTTVVTYDRAGLGWSDPTGTTPTAAGYVRDLHDGLEAAGIAAPYILVGHSMGGVYARAFAHAYPREVIGIVLVDPGSERLPAALGTESMSELTSATAGVTAASLAKADAVARGDYVARLASIPADPRWPADTAAAYRALFGADPWVYATIAREGAAAVPIWDEVAAMRIDSLGDIPLVVVTSGKPLGLSGRPDLAAAENTAWRALQAQLASQSPRGRLVVSKESDHFVHLADPGLVASAIEEVLAAARAGGR